MRHVIVELKYHVKISAFVRKQNKLTLKRCLPQIKSNIETSKSYSGKRSDWLTGIAFGVLLKNRLKRIRKKKLVIQAH